MPETTTTILPETSYLLLHRNHDVTFRRVDEVLTQSRKLSSTLEEQQLDHLNTFFRQNLALSSRIPPLSCNHNTAVFYLNIIICCTALLNGVVFCGILCRLRQTGTRHDLQVGLCLSAEQHETSVLPLTNLWLYKRRLLKLSVQVSQHCAWNVILSTNSTSATYDVSPTLTVTQKICITNDLHTGCMNRDITKGSTYRLHRPGYYGVIYVQAA